MIDGRVLAVLFMAGCLAPAAAKEPFPQPLQVSVVFTEQGPETVREHLERALLLELDRSGCFPRVDSYTDAADGGDEALLLRLAVEEWVDETSFDLSIAERHAPHALPDTHRQLTHWLDVRFHVELHVLPGPVPVRTKFRDIRTGYRPRLDEDPREENRFQAIDEVVRAAKAFVCRGSPKKLRKEIDRARAASTAR